MILSNMKNQLKSGNIKASIYNGSAIINEELNKLLFRYR